MWCPISGGSCLLANLRKSSSACSRATRQRTRLGRAAWNIRSRRAPPRRKTRTRIRKRKALCRKRSSAPGTSFEAPGSGVPRVSKGITWESAEMSSWYHFETTYKRSGQETARRTQPRENSIFHQRVSFFSLKFSLKKKKKKKEEDLRCSFLPTSLTRYTLTRIPIDISVGLKDRQRVADVMRRDKAIFESINGIGIIYTPMRLMDVITRGTRRFSTLYLAARYIGRANPSSLLPQRDLSFTGFSKFTVIHKVIFRLPTIPIRFYPGRRSAIYH